MAKTPDFASMVNQQVAQGGEVTTLQGNLAVGEAPGGIIVVQISTIPGKVYQFPMDRIAGRVFLTQMERIMARPGTDVSADRKEA